MPLRYHPRPVRPARRGPEQARQPIEAGVPADAHEPAEEEEHQVSRWKVIRDRILIVIAALIPFFLLFLMLTDIVRNGQCPPAKFFQFQCNRFDTTFKRWE